MASIREVAAEARVSLSTVSKVLNERTDAHISPATTERVRAAARRVGYHPSAIARGLAGKRMNTVGLIMAYDQYSVTSDPYLGPCLDGILDVNKKRRQKTVLFTEDGWEDALNHLPSYCDGHCDGLMIIIPRLTSEIVEAMETRRGREHPFVVVGDSRESETLVTVDVDNATASREAVQHLSALGHRRIAAFCGNHDFCSNRQRHEGYRLGLLDAGIAFDTDLVFSGEYYEKSGYDNACLLIERFADVPVHPRPTAVFCFNDRIAIGALRAFGERGVRVPEEMSVIGFDDIKEAAEQQPALTTIRQTTRLVGECAATTLLAYIDGEISAGHKQWMPTELIVRETTAKAPLIRGKLS